MLYRAKFAVYSEISTKQMQCGEKGKMFNEVLDLLGHESIWF
jgi:hypothetical protein